MNHQPFLASLQSPVAATPFAQTLPIVATPPANSPWSPKPVVAAAPVPAIDVAAIRVEAIASGRADGLKETEKLRAQLASAVAKLDAALASAQVLAAAQIADAATTVVEAWLGRAPQFQPLITAWLARTQEPSTARANPADVDALRAAIGEAPIAVVADPGVARGDLSLRGPALELDHKWSERLAELRIAIQAEIQ